MVQYPNHLRCFVHHLSCAATITWNGSPHCKLCTLNQMLTCQEFLLSLVLSFAVFEIGPISLSKLVHCFVCSVQASLSVLYSPGNPDECVQTSYHAYIHLCYSGMACRRVSHQMHRFPLSASFGICTSFIYRTCPSHLIRR